jgi:hypothetical protein
VGELVSDRAEVQLVDELGSAFLFRSDGRVHDAPPL